MRLVYLSPLSWSSFAQRPHKFVEWFHARTGGEVLWVDPYPTRFPVITDFGRLRPPKVGGRKAPPSWLRVISPYALPVEPLPGSGLLNRFLWRDVFDAAAAFAEREVALVGIGKPSLLALALLSRFDGCRSVYDAMDDFPAFYAGISRVAMRRREHALVGRVTQMLASSTALKERWVGLRPDVRLVLNGLDGEVLPSRASGVRSGERRIFGYVGTIASWFDWEWLIALAASRPSDVIRLIGPVFARMPDNLPNNIELLPACDHQSALAAMQEFDAGLIPFKKNVLTDSVDPIKYYEYRALGLPVISTSFGEMRCRAGEEGVYLIDRIEDMPKVVAMATQYRASPECVQEFIEKNSWQARFDSADILPQ